MQPLKEGRRVQAWLAEAYERSEDPLFALEMLGMCIVSFLLLSSQSPRESQHPPLSTLAFFWKLNAGNDFCPGCWEALRNNLSIDAQYYIEHQLQLPLLRIFGPIMGSSGCIVPRFALFAFRQARDPHP